MKILVTGGAGFIGSALIKRMSEYGWSIDVIDNLSKQVHGNSPETNSETFKKIKNISNVIIGDASDVKSYESIFDKEYDSIICLAAETGTGQSMYQAKNYCQSNISSIALLNDLIVQKKIITKKIILASSRAVYGEATLDKNKNPYPSSEDDKLDPKSIYAITKLTQEQLILTGFPDISALIFRFQNVYGPGQSLINPYTGILSIFSTALLNDKDIYIFEDGLMTRDFVYIDDIVDGLILGIQYETEQKLTFNLGSGEKTTVLQVANTLKRLYQKDTRIIITGEKRIGDIRHNYADLKKANQIGYVPKVTFANGICKFAEWVLSQNINKSMYEESIQELRKSKLLK
jgi:dTDP-L-rhamnose 4-epimerase